MTFFIHWLFLIVSLTASSAVADHHAKLAEIAAATPAEARVMLNSAAALLNVASNVL